MPAETSRRLPHGDDTRRRILDAATSIAAERGYDGTSMSQISERADVSMSSIYWHFADKDAVIAAVIQRSFDEWTSEVDTWDRSHDLGRGRCEMVAAITADIIGLTRHSDFMRLGLMLALEQRPTEALGRAIFVDVRRNALDRLEAAFARLIADTASGVEEQSRSRLARRLATTVMAAADGLFVAHCIDPDLGDLADTAELMLAGAIDRALAALPRSDS